MGRSSYKSCHLCCYEMNEKNRANSSKRGHSSHKTVASTKEDSFIKVTDSEQFALSSRGYKLLKKLNEGSYAKVYLTEYKKVGKTSSERSEKTSQLACKVIDTQTASKDFVKKFLPREIDVLIKLNHPHLVHTHSIFQRHFKYYIFMRYMENGDLLEYIVKNGTIHEDQARIWTRQVALAIQYMHEIEIAHRDIKCENILLTSNMNAKLSDFGFSRYCVDLKMRPVFSETFCGSLSYTAPEILQGTPYAPKPTDIWSLGVVLYVMLNRTLPFDDKSLKQLLTAQLISNWHFRTRVINILSDNCKRLVKMMLEPDVSLRINILQVINSDWIAMDSRLLVWTNQETRALKKAKEEKKSIVKQMRQKKYLYMNDIKRHETDEFENASTMD